MKTKELFFQENGLAKSFNFDYEAYVADYKAKNEAKPIVRNYINGVLQRATKVRAQFLNRSISFPVSSVVVNSLFISNKEKQAGKDVTNAEKVFCSMTFTDAQGNKLDVNDDFDTAKQEFAKAGKNLINEDGTSNEIQASINEGNYVVVV